MDIKTPNFQTSAICGLFCSSCMIYLATQKNDTIKLQYFAEKLNTSVDQVRCNGCRSDVLTTYCKNCYMKKCSSEKMISFCSECDEYPCNYIKEFQKQMPHRVELFDSLNRIKEVGWEQWFGESEERVTCTQCHQICSWYETTCSNCENTPSSPFVKDHIDILNIKKVLD